MLPRSNDDRVENVKPESHLLDSSIILQPYSSPHSVKVTLFSSQGCFGVLQYFAGAATYQDMLIRTNHIKKSNYAPASPGTVLACSRPYFPLENAHIFTK